MLQLVRCMVTSNEARKIYWLLKGTHSTRCLPMLSLRFPHTIFYSTLRMFTLSLYALEWHSTMKVHYAMILLSHERSPELQLALKLDYNLCLKLEIFMPKEIGAMHLTMLLGFGRCLMNKRNLMIIYWLPVKVYRLKSLLKRYLMRQDLLISNGKEKDRKKS